MEPIGEKDEHPKVGLVLHRISPMFILGHFLIYFLGVTCMGLWMSSLLNPEAMVMSFGTKLTTFLVGYYGIKKGGRVVHNTKVLRYNR